MTMDFDWGHPHKNDDGTKFEKGVVHVQGYREANGEFIPRDSRNARLMTYDEIQTYGPIILFYNPNARFR